MTTGKGRTIARVVSFLLLCIPSRALALESITIASPKGIVQLTVLTGDNRRLSYRIAFKHQLVIETSPMGIVVDDVNLGEGVEVNKVDRYRVKETYPWRGVHSEAVNHCYGARISIRHVKSNTSYTVDVRVFDDGVAFRYVVPGDARSRVPDEATVFSIPAGSTVWYHDFEGHYEGIHRKKDISELQAGEWAAPPLTFKLPGDIGYASITEAALIDYSGMAFQADGHRGFHARLGHAEPVSYPFRLRYGADEAKRLAIPAAITGTITSPWRVVMTGSDLNTLVNCDIIHNVSASPDKAVFPQGLNTEWIKPGRAVWKYLDGGESTLEGMKEFSRMAGELGFEYNVVEGFWQKWSEAQLRELIDYSNQHQVRIWLWKHSKDLRDPEARRKFLRMCHDVGAAGVKVDFFDHEAKEIVDLYPAILKEAAEFKLMVDFHGANKPTGESRTWPNELTREGIYGLEHSRTPAWAQHNTTLPFTRFLAGPADYTPVHFGDRRKETSWAHQIASAAIFTSPLLVYGANPKSILENPAVDMIKSIPSVWDETIALPVCEIGEIAAFARRKDDTWFLAIMNGPTAKTVRIDISFLGRGQYRTMLVRDQTDNAAAVKVEATSVTRKESLSIELRAGGGFIGKFAK